MKKIRNVSLCAPNRGSPCCLSTAPNVLSKALFENFATSSPIRSREATARRLSVRSTLATTRWSPGSTAVPRRYSTSPHASINAAIRLQDRSQSAATAADWSSPAGQADGPTAGSAARSHFCVQFRRKQVTALRTTAARGYCVAAATAGRRRVPAQRHSWGHHEHAAYQNRQPACRRPSWSSRGGRPLPQVQLGMNRHNAVARYRAEAIDLPHGSRLKWLVSTLFASVVGLTAIGFVVFSSLENDGNSGLVAALERAGRTALEPLHLKNFKTTGSSVPKSDRLKSTTSALSTAFHHSRFGEAGSRPARVHHYQAVRARSSPISPLQCRRAGRPGIPPFNPYSLYAVKPPRGASAADELRRQGGGEAAGARWRHPAGRRRAGTRRPRSFQPGAAGAAPRSPRPMERRPAQRPQGGRRDSGRRSMRRRPPSTPARRPTGRWSSRSSTPRSSRRMCLRRTPTSRSTTRKCG